MATGEPAPVIRTLVKSPVVAIIRMGALVRALSGRLTAFAKVGSCRDPTSQRWSAGPLLRTGPAVRRSFTRRRKAAPTSHRAVAAAITGLLLVATAASAADITVMASGGFTAPLVDVIPEFERTTKHKVVTVFGASTGGAPDSIPVRLARGETADVIILSAEALEALIAQGHIRPGTRTDLVQSRIGMVVRAGARKPDISSVDALVRTLLQARSIAYSASASGTYLATELFPRLGIADQVKGKSRRIVSERVGTVVARGEAEIGFQQISELLSIPGIDYVGPLPDAAQRVTIFTAGIAARATQPDAARALIDFLSSAALVPAIRKHGLDPAVPR